LIDSLRVSVVMPAYNEESIIGAILDRVRAVKEVDEIIVVDDGSKDNTPQVAAT
jgi:glycosyltransferase involved in cell wall biosynthesis